MTTKTITVSEETLGYIECLRKLSDLYESVSDAIEVHYCRSSAEEITDNEYYPLHKAIKDWLYNHMNQAMDMNIYDGDELTAI